MYLLLITISLLLVIFESFSVPLNQPLLRYNYKNRQQHPDHYFTKPYYSKTNRTMQNSHQMARNPYEKTNSEYSSYPRGGKKRNLDVGIHITIPTTNAYKEKVEAIVEALEEKIVEESPVIESLPSKGVFLKPLYKCDDWESKQRICILERDLGVTVTFHLFTGIISNHLSYNITWRKEFYVKDFEERKIFDIDPENAPQNIVIGMNGHELRISPITESDLSYNVFSATLKTYTSPHQKVYFMIKAIPTAFLNGGENLEINIHSHVTLPANSVYFDWLLESDEGKFTLPSNMRVSKKGGTILVSELRRDQEGVLSCAVYTNKNVFATMKRFLLKFARKKFITLKVSKDQNVILKTITERKKRYPKQVRRLERQQSIDEGISKPMQEKVPNDSTLMNRQNLNIPVNNKLVIEPEFLTRSHPSYQEEHGYGVNEGKSRPLSNQRLPSVPIVEIDAQPQINSINRLPTPSEMKYRPYAQIEINKSPKHYDRRYINQTVYRSDQRQEQKSKSD